MPERPAVLYPCQDHVLGRFYDLQHIMKQAVSTFGKQGDYNISFDKTSLPSPLLQLQYSSLVQQYPVHSIHAVRAPVQEFHRNGISPCTKQNRAQNTPVKNCTKDTRISLQHKLIQPNHTYYLSLLYGRKESQYIVIFISQGSFEPV